MRSRTAVTAAGALRAAGSDVWQASRLLLAAKTALAAAIAWYLAPWVPFADAEYSYYAPLGVLVSMYPTLADSARSGLQAILGLATGIAIGLAALWTVSAGAPRIAAVALVVGLGVALGGIRAFGVGREWIAIAGLFVLLLGGADADGFSLSYIVTMAFGVVVGVTVNLLLFPPVYVRRASRRLSVLRDATAERLRDLADAARAGSLDAPRVESDMDALAISVTDVAAEVREAGMSRRGNPRARRSVDTHEENARRLRALERIVFFARDLADVMIVGLASREEPTPLLAEAIRRSADLVAAAPEAEAATDLLAAAEHAVEAYVDAVDEAVRGTASASADDLTVATCLRRIVDASRPFV
ncbi:FUSC family protein [Microbacterium sp. NPDC089189]|uniref:FUSC family protein n=1 Tax=Microbacterium sp. NPDC089189 TaxID=3154972 RepID=UPI00341D6FE7